VPLIKRPSHKPRRQNGSIIVPRGKYQKHKCLVCLGDLIVLIRLFKPSMILVGSNEWTLGLMLLFKHFIVTE
jgi:hypothetical protein